MYNDPTITIIIILAVLAGGLVKGTLGFGMPMVALPIIAFILPPTTAMILLCAPGSFLRQSSVPSRSSTQIYERLTIKFASRSRIYQNLNEQIQNQPGHECIRQLLSVACTKCLTEFAQLNVAALAVQSTRR